MIWRRYGLEFSNIPGIHGYNTFISGSGIDLILKLEGQPVFLHDRARNFKRADLISHFRWAVCFVLIGIG